MWPSLQKASPSCAVRRAASTFVTLIPCASARISIAAKVVPRSKSALIDCVHTKRSMKIHMSADKSFVNTAVKLIGSPTGPLQGLKFGAKDIFDVMGYRTGFGNPVWYDTHQEAAATSPAIEALVSAGASLVGKTTLDELAYSLTGQNVHYGTPVNPACPDRVPGGSSSGSAVAVAAGHVDFSLGSDTAGSVRVPASYCGVYGIRVTWGRMCLEAARPLAPSLDAGGWFAPSAELLRRVGDVLLTNGRPDAPTSLTGWLVATDAFDTAEEETSKAIYEALSQQFDGVTAVLGTPREVEVGRVEGGLRQWMEVFRVVQGSEVWSCHGEWVSNNDGKFGPGIKERFLMCSQLTPQEVEEAKQKRQNIRRHVESLLSGGLVVAVPCAPGPAPLLHTPPSVMDEFRTRLISITSIASLAGLPQVSIPVGSVSGCPVGLGLIGPKGSDEALLQLTEKLAAVLKLP